MRLYLEEAPTVEPITLDEAKLHCKVDGAADNALITDLITAAREIGEKETNRAFITQTWQLTFDVQPNVIEIPKAPLQSIVSIKAIQAVESYVDENSATGQPILLVAATDDFAVDDTVIIDRGGDREEEVVILSIQEDISLTMTTNLTKTHTAIQADRVEVYFLVSPISYWIDFSKTHYGRVMPAEGYAWPSHRGFNSFIVEYVTGYGNAGSDVPSDIRRGILALVYVFYENRGVKTISPEDLRTLFGSKKIYTF